MDYSYYDNYIYKEEDLRKMVAELNKEHNAAIEAFITRGKERIQRIKEYEEKKEYKILGSTYRDKQEKCILLIVRYPDGSQRDERYEFSKIAEMRKTLAALREKHKGVDWSHFHEDI